MIVSDTDCVIDYLRDRAPNGGAIWRARRDRELGLSTVTVFELYFGAPSGRRFDEVTRFLARCSILPVTAEAARQAALDGAALASAGRRLDVPDLLIAGVAKSLGLSLITRNVRHFSRVDGLTLLDPN